MVPPKKRSRSKWVTLSLMLVFATAVGTWGYLVWLERSMREPPNYTLIDERLYMGGYLYEPPPDTEVVLNLCLVEDPYQATIHKWEPIRDASPPPKIEWLEEQVAFIDEHHRAGQTVYVHCMQGVSRSGMVVVAYLMAKHGWSRDQTLEFVRRKRDRVRPNSAFLELLGEWERHLKQPLPEPQS